MCFFRRDAARRGGVRGARLVYNLPYFDAAMSVATLPGPAEPFVSYDTRRVHRGAPHAEFVARYGPTGSVYEAEPGTFDHFVAERYCMFMHDERRGLGLLDIDHQPWPLQRGSADIVVNTMAAAAGITLPSTPPLVHFARVLAVRAWTRQAIE